MQLPREKCTECGMIAHIPLLMRLASSQAILLLALLVLKGMSKEAREEFMRTLCDQIARAQGRARFMALRELEDTCLIRRERRGGRTTPYILLLAQEELLITNDSEV